MEDKVIGGYSFWVIQEKIEQSSLYRIEVRLRLVVREEDTASALNDQPVADRVSVYAVFNSRVIQTAGMQFGHK